jgi:hypothetical protein
VDSHPLESGTFHPRDDHFHDLGGAIADFDTHDVA